MALVQNAARPHHAKRKHNEGDSQPQPADKRVRLSQPDQASGRQHVQSSAPAIPEILQDELLTLVRTKFELKIFSILGSTSIQKRIDAVLQHMSRFHPWDLSVLPGVVFLYAKAAGTNKLVTVLETSKRRITEGQQKWYQYNRVSDKEVEVPFSSVADVSVVEETVLPLGGGSMSADEEEADHFEMMPTPFERAVQPRKTRHAVWFSVFLSRVPVPELAAHPNVSVQTNEDKINNLRR
jgi:hypothetical protein